MAEISFMIQAPGHKLTDSNSSLQISIAKPFKTTEHVPGHHQRHLRRRQGRGQLQQV
jgi:hypothetical protein